MKASGTSRKRTAREPQIDLAKRNRIVLENLGLVKAIAARVHERLPAFIDYNDLTHAGVLGLIDAAAKFDPDQRISFSAYASYRIRGAILDSLRELDWASRQTRRRQRQLAEAVRDLTGELQRTPTDSEVAARMGLDDEKLRELMLDTTGGPAAIAGRHPDREEAPEPEYPAGPEVQPEYLCAREQMQERLQEAMTTLRERHRAVVTMYYMRQMTMKEIGAELGVNESRVSQIHSDALRKMHTVLHQAGIRSAAAF